jgi:2-methylcitrate dehydratase PrpD
VALAHGTVSLAHFMQEALRDEAILSLAERVLPVIEAAPAGPIAFGTTPAPVQMEIRTRTGAILEAVAHHPKGHPENPMSWDEVVAKFEDVTRHASPAGGPRPRGRAAIVAAVQHLEKVPDVADLARLMDS